MEIPRPGEIVRDRFRIDAELGRGGFSVVFRATQLNLGRQVALKMLLPEILGDSYNITLFQREAQFAKNLSHPYIIELYDYGETHRGLPFIVMELLEGRALGEELEHAPIDEHRLWQVTAQVLKALMSAHRQGVVHRDIKPSNIFLCQYSGMADFVKVIDFGIAKALTGPGETTHSSMNGKVTGTPAYMAPEQIHGRNQGAHTDLYALGLVMAEALSGQPIFDPDMPLMDLIRAQASLETEVPLPPVAMASRLGPIIKKACAKRLAERYSSAAEMLADIEAVDFGRINLPSVRFDAYKPPRHHTGVLPIGGQTVAGRYRLEERLSVRPHSVLYRATQLSLDRPVAIKMLRPESASDPAIVEHFKHEVKVGRKLLNPHTLSIVDYGQTDDGLPFIANEWLHGLQLSSVLTNVRLLPDQVALLACQVLYALREAHRHGIIHGDIRPSNIHLCNMGLDEDFAKVADFGRPHSQVTDRAGVVRNTDTDQALGAPHYMAPAQLIGGHTGPHTDLYALGLVMAEALVGHPIYPSNQDPTIIARQQASDAPPPIPTHALEGHLGAIIERATRKPLALRYATAEEMLADLKLLEAKPAALPVTMELQAIKGPGTASRTAPISQPEKRWAFQTRHHVRSAPVLGADGTIYAGSFDRSLYAIYPNGELRWRFDTQGELRASPVIGPDGTVYVGSRDARIYAIDPVSGRARWAYETVGPINASAVVDRHGFIYVGSGDQYFYALGPDGAPRWYVRTQGPVSSTPALGPDGTIYVGSEDEHLYAIDPKGKVRWKMRTGGRIYGSPAVNPRSHTVYVGSEDEYLYAFNDRGRVEWGFEMEFFFASTPVIAPDDTIYIGSNDGTLYALGAEGKVRWTFKAQDAVVAPPTLDAAGNIYIGANDGRIYALGPDGSTRWIYNVGDWIQSSPVVGPDGKVYFGADDGCLYALGDAQGT